jgi:hypothetical protein
MHRKDANGTAGIRVVMPESWWFLKLDARPSSMSFESLPQNSVPELRT